LQKGNKGEEKKEGGWSKVEGEREEGGEEGNWEKVGGCRTFRNVDIVFSESNIVAHTYNVCVG
jgi:hypothetical protein